MANDLTGEFDVVAEFALPAANRVLAAMHQSDRFVHSLSMRVDDTPPPNTGVIHPVVVSGVDAFGDPAANHDRLGGITVQPGSLTSANAFNSAFDAIVNLDTAGIFVEPIEPSHIKGRAQIQVFPPTLTIPDGSGRRLSVHMQVLARYFPDRNTPPLAEFIQGELLLTASITQVVSQAGRILEIDLKADDAVISFTPSFTSAPLSAADLAGISKLIRNAIRTSFLPSNTTLPSGIAHVQFKTLASGQGALAILLNMSGNAGNPTTAHNVFLSGTDHFAFAAGVDFVRATFQPTIDNILTQPVDPVKFDIDTLVHTFHITYTVTLKTADVNPEDGAIVLIITGHAHTSTSWLPDFDFTVRQKFSLTPDGATANLEVGDLSFDTSSWIVDQFKGPAISQIRKSRDRSLAETHAVRTVRDKLSADKNLGNFLRSLFDPPRKDGPPPPPGFQLAYTSVDIRPSGIVLHGSLAVPDFAPPHIEFEQIPTAGGLADNTVFSEPSYSALKTWIPGGTIERFQWSRLGQGTVDVETHKFVLEPQQVILGAGVAAPAIAQGYHPLCLTVTGSRLTASGPVVKQPISGGACAFTSFPLIGETAVSTPVKPPVIAVTHPGRRGELQVAGHAPLRLDASGGGSPNLLVHFADDRSVGKLAALDEALRASGRQDATTAVLAVMTPAQLEKAPFVPSVSYTEDQDGAWERLLGVSAARRPLTAIVSPKRQVLWQQQGDVDPRALADALRKYLVVRKPIKAGVSPGGARVGHPPPNILFDHSAGRALTLRKLTGRPVVLVFWKSVSKPSIDKARALLSPGYKFAGPPPLVLAVNDGDAPDLARKLAAGNGLRDSLVLDPDRKISTAYGVNVWPTVVNVDAQGLVTHVDAGHDLAAAASGA